MRNILEKVTTINQGVPVVNVSIIDNESVNMMSVNDGYYTAFCGVIENKGFDCIMYSQETAMKLLIDAFNNRTRERNYFKKYCELLDNEISDEEFDNEIDNHEDDYVVPVGHEASSDEVRLAMRLAPLLKGINRLTILSLCSLLLTSL